MRQRPLHSLVQQLRDVTAQRPFAKTPDRDLVERFAIARDETAFEELVRRHGPMVLGVCSRVLLDPHSADDAFQASFLVLARKASTLSRPELIGNWLYGVAYRLASKLRAKQRRRRETPIVDAQHVERAAAPTWTEFSQVLDEEVERLPEKFRAAFVLCYLEGNTHERAARILGCPTGSMSWRLERARALLRQRLTRRGITLTAALAAAALAPSDASAALHASLLSRTVKASLQFAGGEPAGACAEAVELARYALQVLGVGKRILTAIVVVCGVIAAGSMAMVGLAATSPIPQQAQVGQPAQREQTISGTSKPAGMDRYGDPLPKHAVARLGTRRFRNPGYIYDIALSPDGKILATAAGERSGSLHLWDVATGRELRQLGGNENPVVAVTFSPDGKMLASAEQEAFARNPAPRQISYARLWDVATGKELRSIIQHSVSVNSVSFSADGKMLATVAVENVAYLWDVDTGAERGKLVGHRHYLTSVVFAPSGSLIATASSDETVRIWDSKTLKELHRFEASTSDIAFSPDGSVLAGGTLRGLVHLWDVPTGKRLLTIAANPVQSPRDWRTAVAFSPDGKSLVCGREPAIWDVRIGKQRLKLHAVAGDSDRLAFSSDGKTIAGTVGESVHLWNAVTGEAVAAPTGHNKRVWSIDYFHDGGKLASGSGDGTVRVWDTADGRERLRLTPRVQGIVRGCVCRVSPDGLLLAILDSSNDSVSLWDAKNGKEIRTLTKYPGEFAQSLGFSPDGRLLAIGSWNSATPIRLWDTRDGKWRRELELHGPAAPVSGEGANQVVFSPNGRLLAAGCPDGTIGLWDVERGGKPDFLENPPPLQQPGRPSDAVTAVAWSPDGRMLATAHGYASLRVRLWDFKTRRELCLLEGLSVGTQALAFSPDSRTVVGADRLGTLCLWEVASGKRRCRWNSQQGGVQAIAFAPNGRTIASGGVDTTVLIWDVASLGGATRSGGSRLTVERVTALWNDLAGDDAERAGVAVAVLSDSGADAVPFLRPRLQPARAPDARRLRSLGADLNSDRFAVRERAMRTLRKEGVRAEPEIRRLLKEQPGTDMRARLEQLLHELQRGFSVGEVLRERRATEVLERIGTAEAIEVLKALAGGFEADPRTRKARASVERLARVKERQRNEGR